MYAIISSTLGCISTRTDRTEAIDLANTYAINHPGETYTVWDTVAQAAVTTITASAAADAATDREEATSMTTITGIITTINGRETCGTVHDTRYGDLTVYPIHDDTVGDGNTWSCIGADARNALYTVTLRPCAEWDATPEADRDYTDHTAQYDLDLSPRTVAPVDDPDDYDVKSRPAVVNLHNGNPLCDITAADLVAHAAEIADAWDLIVQAMDDEVRELVICAPDCSDDRIAFLRSYLALARADLVIG